MAFKNLQERFQANAKNLYNHASTRDGSADGQPYLEFKPTDPRAQEQKNDSRFVPAGSVRRDLVRIGKYIASSDGALFLVNQELLQTGNTFSETRIINPLFILGNIVPGLHIPRSLTGQNAFAVQGDPTQISPASLDAKIFSAGRLQKGTSQDIIGQVVGNGGARGLLSLLPLPTLVKSLTSVFSLKDNGTLGVNQRPELDVNGDFFSVSLWKGFTKLNSPQDNLSAAAANLRVGNFKGATQSLRNAFSGISNTLTKRIPSNPTKPDGRDSTSYDYDGRRYYFSVGADDERYIPNTVDFTADSNGFIRPVVNMSFVNRQPYTIDVSAPAAPALLPKTPNQNDLVSAIKKPGFSAGSLLGGFSNGLNTNPFNVDAIEKATKTLQSAATTPPTDDNPAENSMHFSQLSLSRRYQDDERLKFTRDSIQAQKDKSFAYWKGKSSLKSLGFQESTNYAIGQENNIDPKIYKGGRYLTDMVGVNPTLKTTSTGLDDDGLNAYQSKVGTNTVLVIFYDFGNKSAIPFRAMLSSFVETVTPEINDSNYVGRIERNIVFTGARRECSFTLNIHAFSRAELDSVWDKINHMTGLCFPANYSNGYIVPPFVKLTLGGIYSDQPGYIRSLTHTIDENTTWEVEDGQVPHGVTMNVVYSIIEKAQVTSAGPFYSIVGD